VSFEFQGAYALHDRHDEKPFQTAHLYLDTETWIVRMIATLPGQAVPGGGRSLTRDRSAPQSVRDAVAATRAGTLPVSQFISAMRQLFISSDRHRYAEWRVNAPGLIEMQQTAPRHGRVDHADFRPLNTAPPVPVDLSNAQLSDVRFRGCNFTGVTLIDARLQRAVFQDCTFAGGTFRDSWFQLADFTGQHLRDVDLTRTDFSHANLTRARIERCTMKGTWFDGATLSNGTFAGLTFSNCRLSRATLSGADFSGAVLEDCRAQRAKCVGTIFRGATLQVVDFSEAVLDDAKFGGENAAATFARVTLEGAQLFRTDFTEVTLDPTNARMMHTATFGRSDDKRTRFTRAHLHDGVIGHDWSWLDCTDATFTHVGAERITATSAILLGVDFSGRTLSGNFRNCDLRATSWANCNLEDASFTDGTSLGGTEDGRGAANFTGARLRGTKFNDADLTGVSFAFTDLWEAKFVESALVLTSFANAFAPGVDFTGIKDKQMGGVDFSGAFLVSAKFQEVHLLTEGSKAPSLAGACLLGADFTGAELFTTVLTNARLAAEPGMIVAVLRAREGRAGATYDFHYEPTVTAGAKTGAKTQCPRGGKGPCSEEQLRTEVPAQWRQQD
jgi:uncharacterized protein YjbI with pentapeptide repeats